MGIVPGDPCRPQHKVENQCQNEGLHLALLSKGRAAMQTIHHRCGIQQHKGEREMISKRLFRITGGLYSKTDDPEKSLTLF
mgnify:CR=1 FL=1